jgi:hypothetical protein
MVKIPYSKHFCTTNLNPMKKLILLMSALAFLGTAHAQQIKYKVLQNDPEKFHPKLSINTVIGGIDMSIKNINSINFYVGTFGHMMLQDRLGIQFNAQTAILALGKLGNKDNVSPKELNVGGLLFLGKRTKQTKINVTLKSSKSVVDNKEITTTTTLPVQGNVVKYNGVRGGLYMKSTSFSLQDGPTFDAAGVEDASMLNTGIYAGLISRRISNMVIDATGYGKRFHSLGFDFYVDAVLQFSNKFTLRETPSAIFGTAYTSGKDITDDVKKDFGTESMGIRLGINGFQIAPKSVTDKKFGMCYNFETGYLAYQGFFVKGGVGITLVK